MEQRTTKTIRAELLNFIEHKNMLISHFAENAGINPGTLSRIIHGQQPISVKILDQITSTMGQPDGYFYSLYIDECFIQSAPNWRRLKPFISRCADLNKLEYIECVVGMLMDNLSYSSQLFDVAEVLNDEGKKPAALIIYKKVAESEKYQHAERLAICQYRIFKNSLSSNQEKNTDCAAQFEPFVTRLMEGEQLDALKDLTNLYMSLRRWDRAKCHAEEMGRIARILYEQKKKRSRKSVRVKPSKPLFGYILYSNLLLGSICDEKNDYNQALYYLSLYQDHSWIDETDKDAEITKKQFSEWAFANNYLYRIMLGETDLLGEYVDYISTRESEVLRALFKIIKAANRYDFDIDNILQRFQNIISSQINRGGAMGSYTEQITDDGFANFLADVGAYYINKSKVQTGVKFVLESLAISIKIRNASCIVRCSYLFEKVRNVVSKEDLQSYFIIMMEVNEDETGKEKVGSLNDNH